MAIGHQIGFVAIMILMYLAGVLTGCSLNNVFQPSKQDGDKVYWFVAQANADMGKQSSITFWRRERYLNNQALKETLEYIEDEDTSKSTNWAIVSVSYLGFMTREEFFEVP